MIDAVVVFCSCRDEAEADRIASGLLEHRLAACITTVPAVQSVYRWLGKVESAQEVLLILKTTRQKFPELNKFIRSAHSYDTPEVLALPVIEGDGPYLEWLAGQVDEPAKD
jgi:periplasmic divalent cation tolerance protein